MGSILQYLVIYVNILEMDLTYFDRSSICLKASGFKLMCVFMFKIFDPIKPQI